MVHASAEEKQREKDDNNDSSSKGKPTMPKGKHSLRLLVFW